VQQDKPLSPRHYIPRLKHSIVLQVINLFVDDNYWMWVLNDRYIACSFNEIQMYTFDFRTHMSKKSHNLYYEQLSPRHLEIFVMPQSNRCFSSRLALLILKVSHHTYTDNSTFFFVIANNIGQLHFAASHKSTLTKENTFNKNPTCTCTLIGLDLDRWENHCLAEATKGMTHPGWGYSRITLDMW
jgi:hypothetical protein